MTQVDTLYRVASCAGKHAFDGLSQASMVLKQRQRAGSKGNRRIRRALKVYRCTFCRAWHIGSKGYQ